MAKGSERFIARVISLAVENVRSGRGGPFAALVVRNGRVLATGVNLVTSLNDPTAHAEVVAIREACRVLGDHRLTGCDVYSSCEPCPMCHGAILWARPARVLFVSSREDAARAGFADDAIREEIASPPEGRATPFLRVPRPEALEAFTEWMRKPDRRPY